MIFEPIHKESGKENATSRRTIIKSSAWSIPVIAVAIAAPAAAASTPSGECTPVSFSIEANQSSPESQTVVISAVDPAGTVYLCTITSAINSTTTIGQEVPGTDTYAEPYSIFNMNTSGDGWNGGESDTGIWDRIYHGFSPASGGAIVLNQRASVEPEPVGATPLGSDVQTLTFTFTTNGVPFTPRNFTMDIFDITSAFAEPRPNTNPGDGSPWHPDAGPTGWRYNYWDAVGFSMPPSAIAYTGSVSAYGRGAGAGTLSNPYRRTTQTQSTKSGEIVSDAFTFATFPSGSTMQYTNWDSTRGWHFISISGISFEVDACVV